MRYLVMETHPAYVVLLDENGRFLKAANRNYQIGDRIEHIVELQKSHTRTAVYRKTLLGLVSLSACFCIFFFGYYRPNYTAFATLRIQINPDVEMTISRTDRVLELTGRNEDGRALIEGYSHDGKNQEEVTEDLMERAIDSGYLSAGDTISIAVNSKDAQWSSQEELQIQHQLTEKYGDMIIIHLSSDDSSDIPQNEIVIPVTPATEAAPDSNPPASGSTDDGTDYKSSSSETNDNTDYHPLTDSTTDYGNHSGTDDTTDYSNQENSDDDDDDDDDD